MQGRISTPADPAPAKPHGLPKIVRAFKTCSARRINVSHPAAEPMQAYQLNSL